MEFLVLAGVGVIMAAIGLFIGIFIGIGRMGRGIKEQTVGHLRIDRSEPYEPPRPFLELHGATIETISQKKFVVLKVINENYLSRD